MKGTSKMLFKVICCCCEEVMEEKEVEGNHKYNISYGYCTKCGPEVLEEARRDLEEMEKIQTLERLAKVPPLVSSR